jgi:pyruvyltransferase
MPKTRKNRKGITVFYGKGTNLGDGFNPLIFNHFIGKKHPVYKNISTKHKFTGNECLIGAGSILSWNDKIDPSTQIIVGTGFMSDKPVPEKPLKFISVRGEKTRKKFMRAGIKCPAIYGDLGILLRYIVPPPVTCNKKYTIGFIPHYVDKKCPLMLKAKHNSNWTIIDIDQAHTVKKFVKEIHECNFIISSSLHGIIVADSYGIPAYHAVLSDGVGGGSWKFKDYYSSIKRKYGTVDISSMNEEKIIKQLNPYKVDFDFDGYYQYIKDELNKVA